MGIVAIVFGFLGMALASVQVMSFVRKPKEKVFWWYSHLGNMIANYIAAWTVFSFVTPLRFFANNFILWLWPTVVGVPAIVFTTAGDRRKFAPKN